MNQRSPQGRAGFAGVRAFFAMQEQQDWPLFLSTISIGKLRRGVDLIRHRGDGPQAESLEQ